MRIGILTFHRAHNYGAVLQAYALVNYLRSKGYNAEIIDYRPKSIEKSHGTIPWGRFRNTSFLRKIYGLIRLAPFIYNRYNRAEKFNKFINSLPSSPKIYIEKDSYIKGYDYIICGSDQIWNPRILNGFDKFYTGQINTDAHFISYAASTSINKSEDIKDYHFFLKNFKMINVRENKFKKLLTGITDQPIKQVLDPVFLLSKEEWNTFASNKFKNQQYVLVYQVRRDPSVIRYANEIAQENNCKVIEITAEADFYPKTNRYTTLTPQEFVGAFANAKCVITTSFHGTAFASIFNIPVKTMLFNSPGDDRAVDLLNTLNLKDSTITPTSNGHIKIPQPQKINNMMIEVSKEALIFDEK